MFKLCAFFAILAVAFAAPAPEPKPSVGIAYTAPVVAPAVSLASPISYTSYVAPSVYSSYGYGHLPYGIASPYVVV